MPALAPDALVPVLDLENTAQDALVAALRQARAVPCLTSTRLTLPALTPLPRKQACHEVGFFYVVNGGVDPALMDEAFAASKAFFDLPEAEKRALLATAASNNRGWTPLGEETLDPARQSRGDTKEGPLRLACAAKASGA